MFAALFLAFVVVPLVEIAVIVAVGQALGVVDTIGLLILVSVVGAVVVKHQGLGTLRRVRAEMAAGRVPGHELVDGSLILVAGALLVTPGFVTDACGALLLVPPVRRGVRAVALRRLRRRLRREDVVVRRVGNGPTP